MISVRLTEKTVALFKRLERKGLTSDDAIDWDREVAELEAEMGRGLCPVCCFADCRCAVRMEGME